MRCKYDARGLTSIGELGEFAGGAKSLDEARLSLLSRRSHSLSLSIRRITYPR